MTERETIILIQKGLEVAIRLAEEVGIHSDNNHEQARKWLENKLSEATDQEVSEMKRERGEE